MATVTDTPTCLRGENLVRERDPQVWTSLPYPATMSLTEPSCPIVIIYPTNPTTPQMSRSSLPSNLKQQPVQYHPIELKQMSEIFYELLLC